jgi:hypothetical protein
MEVTRQQRRSDGTATVEGVRYEVPAAYLSLVQLRLRVARWDLTSVDLVDPRTGEHLASLLPLDKARHAEGARRALVPSRVRDPAPRPAGIAPLLRRLMSDYAATGLPPGFVPQDYTDHSDDDDTTPEDE